ncbi:MAG: ATP-binding protein [Ardenticatenaceae bacterium]|nr:ATP-binding protein [Ardenticatenaceae bacterium]
MNLASHTLKQRIAILRWALPVTLAIITILYQLWSAHLAHNYYGETIHYAVEFLFYATVGPLLIFLALTRLGRWLDEKERVEKQARASEQRLASITNASADAILSLDGQGRIVSWNRGAELIFGYQEHEMQGRSLLELLGGREAAEVEFRWLAEGVRQEGFVRGHETTCRDVTGQQISVELTATHLTDEAGQELAMSVILRDVTERQRREAEIRRLNASLREQVAERTRELAEKVEELARANCELQQLDRMRSEFVSLVSHQLRAPLTNMYGALDHIEANCPVMDATCVRMLPILNQQVERLDHMVRDVLNMTRIESGALVLHPEPISVLPIVEQVVEQIRARTAERQFCLPTKPGLPLVFADREQVVEALLNLLDNADKYSPPGQEVVIDVRADQTEVTLSVRDFGPGLLPTDLDRIFEKFHRTDGSDSQAVYGYGLGLYICRRLVEAQGGRIWAENHPSGGAVFSVALPVAT